MIRSWVFAALPTLVLGAAAEVTPARPKAGAPPLMKVSEIRPGMKAVAWTVFSGTEAEPMPIEILGTLKNAWGPRQDIIIGKMGGKGERTRAAHGMSGSPVYVDGKLIGALSLRMGEFTADAICGITPIELMLEISDFDNTRPADARAPGSAVKRAALDLPPLSGSREASGGGWTLTPIEAPLVLSGFTETTVREFGPMFSQIGLKLVQGGASGTLRGSQLAPNWRNSLLPGEAVSGVLVAGDMAMSAMGTVTYNDGKRILGFGHPFLNLGPVNMPLARGEVILTLASAFQPVKMGNATGVVGNLRQDRHSGIMGVLGEIPEMIPTKIRIRTLGEGDKILKEKDLNLEIFVQQKWTPFLMMATLFNGLNGMNEFADDVSFRISGNVDLEGENKLSMGNIFAPVESPVPAPMQMAFWWGDKFNRLFQNSIRMPKVRAVNATLDLIPQRRVAMVENAFAEAGEVDAGAELAVKVYLRPYRGGRIEKMVKVKIPAAFPKGEHRILFSDADTLNRLQVAGGMSNRFIDLPQTVSLINQERTNNKLYVSLVQSRPTVYYDDKTMPGLPPSVANVMQNGRTGSRAFFTVPETAEEQQAIGFDLMVAGAYSLKIKVN